jgi:hypothetical protein
MSAVRRVGVWQYAFGASEFDQACQIQVDFLEI